MAKLRTYQSFWEELKREGKLVLKFNASHILGDQEVELARIKKAITKEKWLDNDFKLAHPFARLLFRLDTRKSELRIRLTSYVRRQVVADIIKETKNGK